MPALKKKQTLHGVEVVLEAHKSPGLAIPQYAALLPAPENAVVSL